MLPLGVGTWVTFPVALTTPPHAEVFVMWMQAAADTTLALQMIDETRLFMCAPRIAYLASMAEYMMKLVSTRIRAGLSEKNP